MPFALLIIGLTLVIASVRNTQEDLFKLVKNDFTGDQNFVFWFLSILVIGMIGYIPKLKPISTGFLALVIIVLFLKAGNPQTGQAGGFFAQFIAAIKGIQGSGAGNSTTETPATISPLSTITPLQSLNSGVLV